MGAPALPDDTQVCNSASSSPGYLAPWRVVLGICIVEPQAELATPVPCAVTSPLSTMVPETLVGKHGSLAVCEAHWHLAHTHRERSSPAEWPWEAESAIDRQRVGIESHDPQ
jgi:hypothetical protein